jgi:hypothetical protein
MMVFRLKCEMPVGTATAAARIGRSEAEVYRMSNPTSKPQRVVREPSAAIIPLPRGLIHSRPGADRNQIAFSQTKRYLGPHG